MQYKIALAGNPNCGKTTLFNQLTGSSQYVGNWPGVTVEKKDGKLKGQREVIIQDLPGIYSLSPYTLEEVVARRYLVSEKPDAILNIIDGSNIERNLYLTTQLIELGIPVLVCVNMMDLVRKNGDRVDLARLGRELGCQVMPISALKGEGCQEAAKKALELAKNHKTGDMPHVFTGSVEHAIAHIEESISDAVDAGFLRWFSIKIFERDEDALKELSLPENVMKHVEEHIKDCEAELDDEAESIITDQRYAYISKVVENTIEKKQRRENLTLSDKIDRIVTNRILALPIFAAIMFAVYYIAMSTVGAMATDWTNDVLFGDVAPPAISGFLEGIGCAPWLTGLIVDGIVAGVGAVLGFVPQMLVLFLLLAFLEGCGYMARIAFIMDRIFRRFGLSGKSFIPMLVGVGCGVPGVMASRTIESDRDRKMTIMTTTFIPCGAKMPIVGLIAGALFDGSAWVSTSAYFVGVAAIVISGIALKKFKMFAGEPAPFVMELPAYHMPTAGSMLRSMWERGWSFIKKAGTIILLSTILIWFLSNFSFRGGFHMIEDVLEQDTSLLASLGSVMAWLFVPLGFGNWKSAVAAITGLVAKENVVGTFGILYGFAEVAESGDEIWSLLAADFTAASAYAFLVFNLLCAPCFAAMGAIKREMNNTRWFWFAIGYQTVFAYLVSLCVYQFWTLLAGGSFTVGTAAAILVLAFLLYMLLRPASKKETLSSVGTLDMRKAA
ncbi:ferrous iron transport protein B [Ihubacter sp. rT4E-8]|uniref:ferrous iron transport protein B n=1 Tax=Ihubacter sp. rT4E-8 TaxID=3242369 RepID=UPI003CE7FD3D